MKEKIIIIEQLKKIYKHANEEIVIFDGINFEISKGDFISITGPSGSGKTTLLNIISSLDSDYGGRVIFMDMDLSKISQEEKDKIRLKKIGFVFQDDSLIKELNVIENIELPSFILHNHKNLKKSMELLKNLSLENIAYKNIYELSGGEKQRIQILRAVRNNPSVLIADEPTGNLDMENALKIMNDFARLNKQGTTIIMATHNLELVKKFSRKIYKISKKEFKLIYEM